MSDEQIFRLLLIGGLMGICPIGVYHRFQSATGERLDRRQEGIFILATLRPIGVAGMLGLLTYAIDPAWMSWSQVSLPISLRWLGVGLGLIAGLLLIWALRSLGPNLTDTVVTRAEHTLVTTGPYGWVRHPFYVATGLAIAASSLLTASWFLALTGGLAMALLVVRTRTEEEKLIERFGGRYLEYMNRTGRFVPRVSHSRGAQAG